MKTELQSGPDPYLHTVPEVAEILRVTPRTVYRLIDSGELVVHRIGRGLRISATDLDGFIKLRRQG